jgi:hypothetical protein
MVLNIGKNKNQFYFYGLALRRGFPTGYLGFVFGVAARRAALADFWVFGGWGLGVGGVLGLRLYVCL